MMNKELIDKARQLLKDYGALSESFLQNKLRVSRDLSEYILHVIEREERKKKIEEQQRINEIDIQIDETLSKFCKNLFPTCEAIRKRGDSWEWAIDSSKGLFWYPIDRLPESVERELLTQILMPE